MKYRKYMNNKEGGNGTDINNGFAKNWYDEYPKAEAPFKHSKSEVEVLDLKEEAKKYFNAETSAFQLKQLHSQDSEAAWLKTALTRGTSSDKVAASIVVIQDNPKYNLAQLTSLVSQARVAKHNQCNLVITSLKDLFLSNLLHPKFKLLKFEDQNLDEIGILTAPNQINKIDASKRKLLSHWYFEDQLREQYEHFVLSLAAIASDTVEANREKAISVMTDLLVGNAEQEHKLLEIIVNKIGDPSSKIASKAVFCLNKLLYEHPNMKMVILKEVEKLLFRKNVGQRAQYYGICLLTQFILTKADVEIANSLIDVYFAFFKACLKKGEPDSRMMAAILTGVNRAYQFAKINSEMLNKQVDSMYKVVHIASFNVSLNALNLLYQVSGKDKFQQTRFYSAFYRKLLDPQIGIASKRAMFLNLLYRALQNDPSVLRLYAFIKRILQTSLYFPANMACAVLYIISKILRTRKDLRQLFIRIKTVIKTENSTNNINENDIKSQEGVDVDGEHLDSRLDSTIITNIAVGSNTESYKNLINIKDEVDKETQNSLQKTYDPFCRNPLYTGVMYALNTELVSLSKHFHPSVTLFAKMIIQEKPIEYTGDPLQDLTLIRFLDRYVFKNPKRLESKKLIKKKNSLIYHTGYTPKGIRTLAVNSMAYLNEREERIPVDELFLYRYMKNKNISKTIKTEDDSDNESVNSEEFNDMLDKLHPFKNFEELDIAGDIGTIKKTNKGIEKNELEENENMMDEEDDESNGISSDEDENVSELENMDDLEAEGLEDEDLSEIEFNENSDVENDNLSDAISGMKEEFTKNKNQRIKNKTKQKRKNSVDNIFVSAEKFSQMLEEQGRTKGKHGSTNMMNTMDGASSKQIDWEIKRHQRLRGSFDRKKRKGINKHKKENTKRIKR